MKGEKGAKGGKGVKGGKKERLARGAVEATAYVLLAIREQY
jgi:hypothetical protein